MKADTVKHINNPSQNGLSLIELMISITIGLLILASLSTLFVNQNRTRTELDKSNRMIDNGRYALELLSDDLRLAGFYGEFAPTGGATPFPAIPAALTDPCSTVLAVTRTALQLAIQGVAATTATTAALSNLCAIAAVGETVRAGSDILVVRRVSTVTPTIAVAAANGITVYLQASRCRFDAVSFILDTAAANFTLRNTACTVASVATANLRPFMTQVYFVSTNNNNSPADSIPTLKRLEINPANNTFVVRPLVEGIENMQLDYGWDTTGDGVADFYVQAPAAIDWPNIVAVRINILARNSEATAGYTDTKTYNLGLAGPVTPGGNFKRHAYTQVVRLDNLAGRRE